MTKTRKNYAMRISAILLMLTMTSLCMVSGTFAKYAVTKEGSDTARVAKFAFNLNKADLLATQSIDVNLFASSYLKDQDGSYKVQGDNEVVAPGTSGTFPIEIENAGEVAVTATFKLTEAQTGTPSGKSIPIKYIVDDNKDAPAAGDAAWNTASNNPQVDPVQLGVKASATTKYVHWMWVTESDENDTELGKAGTATVTTTITCTVEQDTTVQNAGA